MASLASAFVETRILGQKNGDPETTVQTFKRLKRELKGICGRSINGHEIDAVIYRDFWNEKGKPCIVPDFGHNINCKCEHREPHGVLRLFSLEFAVEGYPGNDFLGTYTISDNTRIIVCSMSIRPEVGKPLLKVN